ncbi:MAG: carboxypeptidase, partial [Aeriscardovia sp.]|nr:carboxypeptidase [Aeriscardovia sp.]
YDMATPFYQTEYDVDHIELPDELKGNIALTYYKSGHMIYTAKDALPKLYSDLKKFYAADAKDMPSIDERPAAGKLGL